MGGILDTSCLSQGDWEFPQGPLVNSWNSLSKVTVGNGTVLDPPKVLGNGSFRKWNNSRISPLKSSQHPREDWKVAKVDSLMRSLSSWS